MNQQVFITLSERELSIIEFIHEFGFCEIGHVMKRFNLKRTFSYEQMRILIRFGLITYKMVVPHFPGVYFLTAKALRLINTDLPLISYIPTHHYSHYMEVLKVYLTVREIHSDATWITERRLIRQKYDDMKGNKEHLPDAILILADEKRIAIEVELSLKTKERLRTILTDYSVDKNIQEVWYFCPPKIKKVVESMAFDLPKIKVHILNEA